VCLTRGSRTPDRVLAQNRKFLLQFEIHSSESCFSSNFLQSALSEKRIPGKRTERLAEHDGQNPLRFANPLLRLPQSKYFATYKGDPTSPLAVMLFKAKIVLTHKTIEVVKQYRRENIHSVEIAAFFYKQTESDYQSSHSLLSGPWATQLCNGSFFGYGPEPVRLCISKFCFSSPASFSRAEEWFPSFLENHRQG